MMKLHLYHLSGQKTELLITTSDKLTSLSNVLAFVLLFIH